MHTLSDGRDIYQTDYTDFSVCQNVLELYFTDIQKMLAFGNFDSLGHLDYPLRVMGQIRPDPTLRDYREQIAPILKELVRQGKGLEINAKGCRSWLGRPGPDEWILKLFKDYGGTILTAGSDAHAAQNCGQGLEQALALARAAGFDQIALFRRRGISLDLGGAAWIVESLWRLAPLMNPSWRKSESAKLWTLLAGQRPFYRRETAC